MVLSYELGFPEASSKVFSHVPVDSHTGKETELPLDKFDPSVKLEGLSREVALLAF